MSEKNLKSFSTVQIEEAIASAITELVGVEYNISIKNIDFSPHGVSMHEANKIELTASQPIDLDYFKST
jgi:hypothetical protein